jgi:hypothetical protein
MDFELTISGLWVLALQSSDINDTHPVEPEAVDIIIPAAHHHHPRLSYLPSEVIPHPALEPQMVIDPRGGRIANLPVQGMVLELSFSNGSTTPFHLEWSEPRPEAPLLESSLTWLPTLAELGFDKFSLGDPGTLPKGAATRLRLPEGELFARNIVRTPDGAGYLLWNFPVGETTRALANEIVFRARGVDDAIFSLDGKTILASNLGPAGTLRMSLANDISIVPSNYNSPQTNLDHLSHLAVLAPMRTPSFQPPTVVDAMPRPPAPARTVKPICNGVVFVYGRGA